VRAATPRSSATSVEILVNLTALSIRSCASLALVARS